MRNRRQDKPFGILYNGSMELLPGLTSTKKERIPAFLEAMDRLTVKRIALFPTCLDPAERGELYRRLERFAGLSIPHVHLRSDADEAEMDYLSGRFSTEAFNIHPRASEHPFPPFSRRYAARIFIENTNIAPEPEEVRNCGGLCPDFSHWENARFMGRTEHTRRMDMLVRLFDSGCCHLSAVRPGKPNDYNGEWDHHEFASLEDFSYLARYKDFMPLRWGSLELQNCLEEQLAAAAFITKMLAG